MAIWIASGFDEGRFWTVTPRLFETMVRAARGTYGQAAAPPAPKRKSSAEIAALLEKSMGG